MINQKDKGPLIILKEIIGNVAWTVTNDLDSNSIVVLNYHGTQKKFLQNFRTQLDFYKTHFEFVKPSGFIENHFTISTKPKLLLTFDDGLRNNLQILDILEEYSIQAFFFIVPKFIESNSADYFQNHIRPMINMNIDAFPIDCEPMTWDEVQSLIDRGHSIGSHSMTHRLNKLMDEGELKREISDSKAIIEDKLNINIAAFCSPNNTLSFVSDLANLMISKHYKLHFTTINGRNKANDFEFPKAVYRTNIEAFWAINQVKWALSGLENKRWGANRGKLKEIQDASLTSVASSQKSSTV